MSGLRCSRCSRDVGGFWDFDRELCGFCVKEEWGGMQHTGLVIPAADKAEGSKELLHGLLYSIEEQNIQSKFEVCVCFDGCKTEFVHFFQSMFPWITSLVNSGNRLNFAANSNRGLRYFREKAKPALVVNQDCVLPALPFVEAIKGEGIAVATPVQVCAEPPISKDDLLKLNKSQPLEIVRTRHSKLIGFCMYFSLSVLKEVGVFDEAYVASFEDDQICVRALLASFPVEHVNVNVQHYVSRCGAYDENRLWMNERRFRAQWQIPDQIKHAEFNDWIIKNHRWHKEMRIE